MAWPVLTSSLPHVAGERHRTGVSGYLVVQPDPPGDVGSAAGGGVDLAGTAERGEPVAHVPQSRPGRRGGRVEAGAVVGHLELGAVPGVEGQTNSQGRLLAWSRVPGELLPHLRTCRLYQ